jgi:hypothetical protein
MLFNKQISALKLVGGAKCQFEDLFVYHAKTTNINQVAFIEIVSWLALWSSCCFESPLYIAPNDQVDILM